VREYELARTLTPDNARVHYILCGMYGTGSVGRYDDGIAACRRSAAMVPSVAAYSNWGAVLSNLRRFDEAIEQFAAAARVGPEDYVLDGDMARAYFHAGRRAEARALMIAPSPWSTSRSRSTRGTSTRASASRLTTRSSATAAPRSSS
jgi:tetratricopeptide (TPR) repeat protein